MEVVHLSTVKDRLRLPLGISVSAHLWCFGVGGVHLSCSVGPSSIYLSFKHKLSKEFTLLFFF